MPADASFLDLINLDGQHTQATNGQEDCSNDIGYSTWEG